MSTWTSKHSTTHSQRKMKNREGVKQCCCAVVFRTKTFYTMFPNNLKRELVSNASFIIFFDTLYFRNMFVRKKYRASHQMKQKFDYIVQGIKFRGWKLSYESCILCDSFSNYEIINKNMHNLAIYFCWSPSLKITLY